MLWGVLGLADNMMFIWCAWDGVFAELAKPLIPLANTTNPRLSSLDLRDLAYVFFAIGPIISSLG